MYWALYITTIALATWGLFESLIRRDKLVLPALLAFGAFGVVALVPDMTTGTATVYNASANATETVTHTTEIGSVQYIFAALSLLMGIWLAGVVIGIFPEEVDS